MSDRADRGAGQKSDGASASAPPPVSRADFFAVERNFDLFGETISTANTLMGASAGRGSKKTDQMSAAVRQLAREGLTRRAIAKQVGLAESTLYANYFSEIAGRRGEPGRRQHRRTMERAATVARMFQDGLPRSAIADALGISLPTLRLHYRKELEG